MQLLELDKGLVSLELRPDELGGVLDSLRSLGGFERQQRVSHDIVSAGGSDLILVDEWHEPCLLSQELVGTQILRDIFTLSSDRDGSGPLHRAVSGR